MSSLLARGVGGEQHFDAAVTLPAGVGRAAAHGSRFAEGAGLNLVARHAGAHECLTNHADPALTERLVVPVGAARIRVAVDADLDGRILLQVGRDLRYLARLVRPEIGLV